MLLDVAADALRHFGGTVTACSFGTAAEAGAISGLFCLIWLLEKGHILAAWTPGWARGTAIDGGGRNTKNEASMLAGVAGQNCLPQLFVLWGCAEVLLVAGHRGCVCQVEYRIGDHDDESLTGRVLVDYPHLAVKAIFLAALVFLQSTVRSGMLPRQPSGRRR
jgi:hypothetical protein